MNGSASDVEQRSAVMRRVKSADTRPELTVRSMLHGLGFRYRLHGRNLPGRPDLVFSSRRKVVFVHGCFWHGHDCKRGARVPHTHRQYWEQKITANVRRDADHIAQLEQSGWQSFVVWECELRDLPTLQQRLKSFLG